MMNFTGEVNCTNVTWEHIRDLIDKHKNSDQAGDATWILTSAFIIFTMQSGFGLLEAGTVSSKNETNIMVKNAVDVVFGAIGYWFCGFAFSFGNDPELSNGFTGFGQFFTGTNINDHKRDLFAKYLFQLSFATTATTIVSGAMAERTNLKAYMFFSFINFFSYVFPAHWVWADEGAFRKKGVVDVAGCGPVHIVGGTAAFVASVMLKPRVGAFKDGKKVNLQMGSPTNVILGTFMLWWGWLGFNCGSTFGVSGGKWKLATRAAVTTVNASVGAGLWGLFYCYFLTKKFNKKLDVGTFTSSILGGLVSITAICAICSPWEALLIGAAGGVITVYGVSFIDWFQIDDPVSAISVHCFCGCWGMLCCGLFGENDLIENTTKYPGITKGGPWSYLGYQMLAALSIMLWSAGTSFVELWLAHLLFGLRVSEEDEILGADFCEHGIYPPGYGEEVDVERFQGNDIVAITRLDSPRDIENSFLERGNPFLPREVFNPIYYEYENFSKTIQYHYSSSFDATNLTDTQGQDNQGFSAETSKVTIRKKSLVSQPKLISTQAPQQDFPTTSVEEHVQAKRNLKLIFGKSKARSKPCILL